MLGELQPLSEQPGTRVPILPSCLFFHADSIRENCSPTLSYSSHPVFSVILFYFAFFSPVISGHTSTSMS